MPLTEVEIGLLVERYVRERDRYEKMAVTVTQLLAAVLLNEAIPHVPTFRSKEPESLEAKLRSTRDQFEFGSFQSDFAPNLLDLAGVRIMLYRPQDKSRTCSVVERLFNVPDGERFRHERDSESDGYRGLHRVVTLRPEQLGQANLRNLPGVHCEVQVVLLTDHIWNELEHNITYKTPHGKPNPQQKNLLKVLRGQVDALTTAVDVLMEATEEQKRANRARIETRDDLSFALNDRVGERIHGDFGRLLLLLRGALKELTPAELDKLPLDRADLAHAGDRLRSAGVGQWDGVGLVISALWPSLGPEFIRIAGTWKGRPTHVALLIRELGKATKAGTI